VVELIGILVFLLKVAWHVLKGWSPHRGFASVVPYQTRRQDFSWADCFREQTGLVFVGLVLGTAMRLIDVRLLFASSTGHAPYEHERQPSGGWINCLFWKQCWNPEKSLLTHYQRCFAH